MKNALPKQKIWVKYLTLEYSWEPIQVGPHCHICKMFLEIPEPVSFFLKPTREQLRFEQYKEILP